MSQKEIASSCLRSIAYSAHTQLLQVEFADGCIYSYSGVPDTLHACLVQAESKGRFFNQMIRNRFPFEKGAAA